MNDNSNNPNNIEVGDLILTPYAGDPGITILAEAIGIFSSYCELSVVCSSEPIANIASVITRNLKYLKKL